jgi:hypothetical protein
MEAYNNNNNNGCYIQSVGLLGQVLSTSQGRNLHKKTKAEELPSTPWVEFHSSINDPSAWSDKDFQ